MIKLINKLLSYINLKLVYTEPDTSLVEKTVNFLDKHKDCWNDVIFSPPYVGDINYVQEKVKGEFPQVSGKTYIETKHKYYDYEGGTYTTKELQDKLR